mgnify:FL=1
MSPSTGNWIGERDILYTTSSADWATVIYQERGEYYSIVTKGRQLPWSELEFAPGTHIPKRDLFPRASQTFPPTVASLPPCAPPS